VTEARTLNLSLRPKNFGELIGSEEQVAVLQKALAEEHVPVAVMLVGGFGCGKTTIARIFAHEVQGFDCPDEKSFEQFNYKEINAANLTGVDDMRALVSEASVRPFTGKYTVITLDEAQQLSKAAQQLLLKETEKGDSTTIWVFCTTDPEKLLPALRSRCLTVELRGMDNAQRTQLVARCAEFYQHTAPTADLLVALSNRRVASPRSIVMAFEAYHNGMGAEEAVDSVSNAVKPEFHEIAFSVRFGRWDKDIALPWKPPKTAKAVKTLLEDLDTKLKKEAKKESSENEQAEGEEDVSSRPETARALRNVIAAYLKGIVLKSKSVEEQARAADALQILSHCVSPNAFDAGLEYPATIAGIYRVCKKLVGV
jgi:shikimate kinase